MNYFEDTDITRIPTVAVLVCSSLISALNSIGQEHQSYLSQTYCFLLKITQLIQKKYIQLLYLVNNTTDTMFMYTNNKLLLYIYNCACRGYLLFECYCGIYQVTLAPGMLLFMQTIVSPHQRATVKFEKRSIVASLSLTCLLI